VIKFFYGLLLSFFGAVIVHICIILFIPSYTGHLLMERLKKQHAGWQFVTLDPEHPIAARLDPAFRLRICHFDLSEEPIHLTAEGNVPFWSLSLYDQDSNNLYSLNSRIMPGDRLDLVVGTPIQIMDYKRDSATDDPLFTQQQSNSILTQHSILEGFIVLRTYVPSADWDLLAEAFLQSARCDKIG